jgi:hypothetical protein
LFIYQSPQKAENDICIQIAQIRIITTGWNLSVHIK